ncbi:hypothetical protein E2C01_029517 [Portunus trituberculatus]|uniref:Uncharacterized protein n=1 Tax=Portunus trituberculatus TaxID=210409 RepID=A0A5B7EN52_PORTR|nr:hypothetical protein [Portunus trituberculatus]
MATFTLFLPLLFSAKGESLTQDPKATAVPSPNPGDPDTRPPGNVHQAASFHRAGLRSGDACGWPQVTRVSPILALYPLERSRRDPKLKWLAPPLCLLPFVKNGFRMHQEDNEPEWWRHLPTSTSCATK